MKADLTRSTFDPRKHYRAVRMQQGRVQLDADWNEQQDILNRRVETETLDVIGAAGVPVGDAFLLTGAGKDLRIGAGRCYVAGLLCENETEAKVSAQPDWPPAASPVLPEGATLPPLPPPGAAAAAGIVVYDGAGTAQDPPDGLYLGTLEVWQRHLTALEDPAIREVALGGPDTATREKTVWQLKLLPAGALGAAVDCATELAAWSALVAPPDGRLAARAEPDTPPRDPCLLAPEAGFRSLENLLYRVEIHDDGSAGKLRYKWSRDNGAIVTPVLRGLVNAGDTELEVASLGRDERLALGAGCWIELIDDTHELLGRPGPLVKVLRTAHNRVTVDPATRTGPLEAALFARNPRVRRWDGIADAQPAAPGSAGGWVALEDGVQIKLTPGRYRAGDYWSIAARTATADVEWPLDAAKNPVFTAPQGVLRAFARLAVLSCQAGVWTRLLDCRHQFPALTALTNLYYVGGDGQEVAPDPLAPAPVALPSPLEVAVFNGQHPVAGAQVRFSAAQGSFGGAATQTVATGADGVAAVSWQLAPDTVDQRASAELLVAGAPATGRYSPVRFSARLSLAAQVAYDPADCADLKARQVRTVQAAIDALCARAHGGGGGCCVTVGPAGGEYATLDEALSKRIGAGERDICICLLPGEHALAQGLAVQEQGLRLRVHGAGRASRLLLRGRSFSFAGLAALALAQFDIVNTEGNETLQIADCIEVELQGLRIAGLSQPGRSVLQVDAGKRVDLTQSDVIAYSEEGLKQALEVLRALPALQDFETAFDRGNGALFADLHPKLVQQAVDMSPDAARELTRQIDTLVRGNANQQLLTREATQSLLELRDRLAQRQVNTLGPALEAVRLTLLLSRPSHAAALGNPNASILVSDCRIGGRLSLGSESSSPEPMLNTDGRKIINDLVKRGLEVLAPGAGDVRLRNNRLRDVRAGDVFGDAVQQLLERRQGLIPHVPRSLIAADNSLAGPPSELFAIDLSLSTNMLNPTQDVGTVLAVNSKYIGNFAGETRLFNISRTIDQFGNAPLQIS